MLSAFTIENPAEGSDHQSTDTPSELTVFDILKGSAGVDHCIAKAADPALEFRHMFGVLLRALRLFRAVIRDDVIRHVVSFLLLNSAGACVTLRSHRNGPAK